MKYSFDEITGDLRHYFNWSINALLPRYPGAADNLLTVYGSQIKKAARDLLWVVDYKPGTLYRGIIMRQPITEVTPAPSMKYLSFSIDKTVAEHFADVNGFGSDIIDVATQLGEHGYVIEYTPQPEEVLFHYSLLDLLPYSEAFYMLGIDGLREVQGLKQQKEVMILQPASPLKNIKKFISYSVTQ